MSVLPAATIWRDKEVDGVYSSDNHDPVKSEIREYQAWVEAGLTAGTLNGPWEATLAALNAKLAYGDGNPGFVYAGADFGTYRKSGASGSGSWVKILDTIPGYQFVKAVDAGAGTANAIVATSAPPVAYSDGAQLIRLNIFETNTSGTVTVAFNGGTALTIETSAGNPPAVGGLPAGMQILGMVDQSATVFRMLSDQASAAIQAASEAAQAAAEAARDEALGAVANAFSPTRLAMSQLNPATKQAAYLKVAGSEGQFFWDASDLSAIVAIDTVEGDYIAPDFVGYAADGSNGAWVRFRNITDRFLTSQFGGGPAGLYAAQAVASARATLWGAGVMATVLINDTVPVVFGASDTGVVVPPNVNIRGLGKGKTILDISALAVPNLVDHVTGQIGSGGRRFMDVRPAYGSFDALYSLLPSFVSGSTRKSYLDFDSDPSLAIGDIFILYAKADYSWMATRPEYRKGDRFKVIGVDTVSTKYRVYLDHALRDDYTYVATPGSEVQAFKQTVRGGHFGGFTIKTTGSPNSSLDVLAFHSCDGLTVDNIEIWDAELQGFQFNQCFNCVAEYCDATTKLSDGNTSVYPFSFRNSTKCRIRYGSLSSDWHSIDFGGYNAMGAVLNHDCVAEDIDGYGSGQSSTAAAAFNQHGNADLCGFRRCKGHGYIFGGRDSFFDDGELVLGGDATAADKLVHAGEVQGGRHRISRNKMYSNRNTGTGSNGGAIFLDDFQMKAEVFVQMWDNDIEMPAETQPIRLSTPAGALFPISLDLRGRFDTPAAAVAVRIVAGDNALTASHFRMDVYDLPSGVAYANSTAGAGGHLSVTEWKFPEQIIKTAVTPTASAVYLQAPITYPHTFPATYTPSIVTVLQDSNAGDKAGVRPTVITSDTYRPRLYTGDGTNLTAAATTVLAVVR